MKSNGGLGWYSATRSLDGLGESERRGVVHLELRGFDGDAAGRLELLRELPDIRALVLRDPRRVDLSPLVGLPIEQVVIVDGRDLDLAPLGGVGALRDVLLTAVTATRLPSFRQTPKLEGLGLIDCTADLARRLWNGLAWDALSGLRDLQVEVVGPSADLDLGRLGGLAGLRELRLARVDHAGGEASPLVDPFDGLPRALRSVHFDIDPDDATGGAKERRLRRQRLFLHLRAASGAAPEDVSAGIAERWPPDDAPPPTAWIVHEPDEFVSAYWMAGSLAELFDLEIIDGEAEIEAAAEARHRVRRVDPELDARITWDEDGGGEIRAGTRSDLERVRRILGVDADRADGS